MRFTFLWIPIIGLLLFAGGTMSVAAQSATPERGDGVVRAVLFWNEGCPYCHVVIDQVLPPLQQQYGVRLDIQLLETSNSTNARLLSETAAAAGLTPGQVGVPFLVIGDRVLIGSVQIPTEFPVLIEQYLAQGGVDYPPIPGLAAALSPSTPAANPVSPVTTPAMPPSPRPEGYTLALVTIGGIVATLLMTATTAYRGIQRAQSRHPRRGRRGAATHRAVHPIEEPIRQDRWEWARPTLILGGLGVAIYLAYVETQAVPAICGPIGDCNAVQSSPYAMIFGVIPIAVLGVVFYLGMLAAWFWSRTHAENAARYAPLIGFGLALVGVLFSLYLTYLEAFVIEAICAWCLTSAVVITLLLLISTQPALRVYTRLRA